MDIIVNLTAAILCFAGHCYPALTGKNTFPGEYDIVHRYTNQPGYGGDVLKYDETNDTVYAIHRVWLLKPNEHRLERLNSDNLADRKFVTNGCINIKPEVYTILVESCKYGCRLIIQQ